jgi:hypothetical protein
MTRAPAWHRFLAINHERWAARVGRRARAGNEAGATPAQRGPRRARASATGAPPDDAGGVTAGARYTATVGDAAGAATLVAATRHAATF